MNFKSKSLRRRVSAICACAAVISFSILTSNAQLQKEKIILIGKTIPTIIASGTISGRVFQDYNGDGIFETTGGTAAAPTAIDVGVGGITVSLYDAAGVLRGTATSTAGTGLYSITATGTGPYRVEFTTIPAGYSLSARSTDSVGGGTASTTGSTEQFVTDGSTANVNLALNRPQDYCEDNPSLCSQNYGLAAANTFEAIFTIPYTAGSTRTTGGLPVTDFMSPGNTSVSNTSQVGTTFGLAYQRSTRRVFAAAFMKKHAKFGPGGTGSIYQIDRGTGTVSEYANLNTIFGANTAGANPHDTANYSTDNGQATWDAVGKVAFGGMAISDDQTNLYVMNLADRKLYRIPTSGALNTTTIQSVAFPTSMPNCAAAVEVRPFAVTWYQGTLYVGAVCSRETSGGSQSTNLRAYVYRLDPTTFTFAATPDVNFQLNYPRQTTDPGIAADWLNWRTTFSRLDASHFIYPQPMLTSIAFDNGNLILGLRDRDGDQTSIAS
ncbi:MAG: SdrD B-like domain-containing protein, partial [Pyrinomonadaceae bacterium]